MPLGFFKARNLVTLPSDISPVSIQRRNSIMKRLHTLYKILTPETSTGENGGLNIFAFDLTSAEMYRTMHNVIHNATYTGDLIELISVS